MEELAVDSLSAQPPPPLVVLGVEVSQHLGKLQQGEGQGGWVSWWEVSWGEVGCATDLDLGFPPGGSLAVASSLAAREPPVLQEEVEGRLGREGGGGRRGGRELVCLILMTMKRGARQVPLMTTRVPLGRGPL